MSEKSWDDRFAEFLERVMAAGVAKADPKPFQEEYKRLMAEKPPEKEDAGSRPLPAVRVEATGTGAPRPKGRGKKPELDQ